MTAIGLGRAAIAITVVLTLVAPSARAELPGASTSAPATGTEKARAAAPGSESAGSVAGRVVAEVLMGSGLATVGYLAGPKVAGAACSQCLSAAGFAGANALFPLGVYWGGRLVRGQGLFLLTVAAPWLVSATTFIALARDGDYDGKPALQIGSVGGAIAAPLSIVLYELNHAVNRVTASRASTIPRIQVAIGPHQDGVELLFVWRP